MKTPVPSTQEKNWLLIGSRSVTTIGIHAHPGPISGSMESARASGSLLRDYGDESEWSRRIETKAPFHHSIPEIPEDDG